MLTTIGTQAATKAKSNPHGIDVTNMVTTVKPGTDFYRFATGKWSEKNPMPAESAIYGSFKVLVEENNKRLQSIIKEMSQKTGAENTVESKIGILYNQVVDTVRLNKEGIAPLLKYTRMIDGVSERRDLTTAAAELCHYGVSCFFDLYVDADAMDSKQNLVQISQGGLTLGQRDYYLDTDDITLKLRNAYRTFGQKVFAKVYPDATADDITSKMNDVIRIETRLASSFSSNAALRLPENNYHNISLAFLNRDYPAVHWNEYFETNHFRAFSNLSVNQPEALTAVNDLFANEKIEAMKNYMVFRLACTALPFLSDDLRALNFDFFGKTMSGTEKELPAWKRGVNTTNDLFGEAIGRVYSGKFFPKAAKERMQALVKNLQTALGERIKAQDWMSEETKAKALDKLSTFYVKIGYPDKWRDYSGAPVDKNKSLLDNFKDLNAFNADYYAEKKVGRPVDRDEWYMTPQTVNAYYNPSTNEICFPAGILQYPFFDMEADDAFNYGAIGVVIGHEMTHGFDDQGRKYDKEGNLKEWWSAADAQRFNEKAKVIVDYFNNIKVLPDLNANGVTTEGENLADHGGLQVSYAAFKNATKGKKAKTADGFTPDQRFFIAYAGVWAGSIRTEEIRKRVKMDSHSLAKWRVNGTLPHINAWYRAFNITSKDPLFIPEKQRLTIW